MRKSIPVFVLLGLAAVACSEEVVRGSRPPPQPNASASASGSASAAPTRLDVQENEFNESERSRDPFRSAMEIFSAQPEDKRKGQRKVELAEFSVADLKLVGIVSNSQPPMALLVDPRGKGHTVVRGMFIGRAEEVQSAGKTGARYEVNWKIDRIRDGSIVLIREDPRNPDVPGTSKVIWLRPDEEPETAGL